MTKVSMGIFGKHPGWDDFLWYGGDKSPHIDKTMSLLYEEGINRNIESSVWGDPTRDLEKIVNRLDHSFLWNNAGQWVLGQWWPSRDRLGRLRPLGICAVPEDGQSLEPFVRHGIQLMNDFRIYADNCTDQESLTEKLSSIETEFNHCLAEEKNAGIPGSCVWLQEKLPPEKLPGVLLAICKAVSPHVTQPPGNAFKRMKKFFGSKLASMIEGERDLSPKLKKMRLPVTGSCPEEILTEWGHLFHLLADPDISIGLFLPASCDWLDLFVGPPAKRDDFRFLGIENIPFLTDAPRKPPEQFSNSVTAAVESGDFSELLSLLPEDE